MAAVNDNDVGQAFSHHKISEEQRKRASMESELKRIKSKMSWRSRITLFLVFPVLMGLLGCGMSYLSQSNDPNKKGDVKIDLDRDFAYPFLLSLVLVIVIGFQTKGFNQGVVDPLFAWPKVRKKRRIIRKRIIVDDDDESGEADALNNNDLRENIECHDKNE